MAGWHAIFRQTEGLRLLQRQSGRSSGEEFPLPRDRPFFLGRFPRRATPLACLLEWSQTGAQATVTHRILQLRFAPDQNRELESDSSHVESLQLRRQLADQIFDLLRFVPVTDQKRVLRSYNNKIMNSK